MPRSTQERLKTVCEIGNLRVADLARWFATPYQTVRGWIERGWEPRGGGPGDVEHIMALLGLLETMVKKRQFLPMPKLSLRGRVAYLKKIRKAVVP